MPKYVWVSEISTIDWQNQLNDHSHLTLGEILIDPSSNPQEYDFISIHLPSVFFETSIEDENPILAFAKGKIISHDFPYLSLKRSF